MTCQSITDAASTLADALAPSASDLTQAVEDIWETFQSNLELPDVDYAVECGIDSYFNNVDLWDYLDDSTFDSKVDAAIEDDNNLIIDGKVKAVLAEMFDAVPQAQHDGMKHSRDIYESLCLRRGAVLRTIKSAVEDFLTAAVDAKPSEKSVADMATNIKDVCQDGLATLYQPETDEERNTFIEGIRVKIREIPSS